jgi:hypothetical protein
MCFSITEWSYENQYSVNMSKPNPIIRLNFYTLNKNEILSMFE